MKKINKLMSFAGKNIYVGLDVHKKSWKVTILTENSHHKTFSQDPAPSQLAEYLHRNFPDGEYRAVYEAGCFGFWIYRELSQLGIDCVIVHPPDVPTKDSERDQKTDRRDSRKLAKLLRGDLLEGINVPTTDRENDRSLIRARSAMVGDQTRIKNRIKGLLCRLGIALPLEHAERGWTKAMLRWLDELKLSRSVRAELDGWLNMLRHYQQQIRQIQKEIRTMSKRVHYCESVKILTSTPGIGLISAMTLLTELGDIRRFKGKNELCSYVGLIPSQHSSGEKERKGRITKRANKRLRHIIVECAWVIKREDPAMLQAFEQLCERMKPNQAIIRIARKLLSRIRSILLNKCEYQIGVVA